MRISLVRSMAARGALIAVIGVAACSPDTVGPPVVGNSAPAVNSQRIGEPLHDAVDDLPFMRAAGCTEVRGLPPVGTVRFQGKDGRWRSYTCPGVGKAAVRAAIGRFHEAKAERAARGTGGQVRAMAATGYFILTAISTEWCVQTQTHLEIGGVRVYTQTTIVPGSCFWVTFYSVEYIGGEMPEPWEDHCCAGPGDPGDDDPPPPPPPPADTVCATITQDANGALNWKPIQDSLAAIHAEAVGAGTEMGGILWQQKLNGPIYFLRLDTSDATNCHWFYTGGGDAPGFIVGYFHTHLYSDGDQYTCPGDPPGTIRTANNAQTGGGSPADPSDPARGDWGVARTLGKPVYVIDPDFIWRLDPSTPVGSEGTNPNQWVRTPNGCALP